MIGRALTANAAADALRTLDGVIDAVAGVESLVVRFDPATIQSEYAKSELERALSNPAQRDVQAASVIDIPVCYGGEYGPDLELLTKKLGINRDDLITFHSSQTYNVLTVGFAPGFAYLGPLPDELKTSRLATPRARVPAGSVGVAGAMTGVYALASPGGWPLIGRTPKMLFDARSDTPFIFSPGAKVRFVAIDEARFKTIEAARS